MSKFEVDPHMVEFRDAVKNLVNNYVRKTCLCCERELDSSSPLRLHDRCVEKFLTQLSVDLLDVEQLSDTANTLWHSEASLMLDAVQMVRSDYDVYLYRVTQYLARQLTREIPVGFVPVDITFTTLDNPDVLDKTLRIDLMGNPICFHCQTQGRDPGSYYALVKPVTFSTFEDTDPCNIGPTISRIHPALHLSRVGRLYVHQGCLTQYLEELKEYAISHRISYPTFKDSI